MYPPTLPSVCDVVGALLRDLNRPDPHSHIAVDRGGAADVLGHLGCGDARRAGDAELRSGIGKSARRRAGGHGVEADRHLACRKVQAASSPGSSPRRKRRTRRARRRSGRAWRRSPNRRRPTSGSDDDGDPRPPRAHGAKSVMPSVCAAAPISHVCRPSRSPSPNRSRGIGQPDRRNGRPDGFSGHREGIGACGQHQRPFGEEGGELRRQPRQVTSHKFCQRADRRHRPRFEVAGELMRDIAFQNEAMEPSNSPNSGRAITESAITVATRISLAYAGFLDRGRPRRRSMSLSHMVNSSSSTSRKIASRLSKYRSTFDFANPTRSESSRRLMSPTVFSASMSRATFMIAWRRAAICSGRRAR